jgi:hypothetical protein
VGYAVGIRDAVADLLRGNADRQQVVDLLQQHTDEPWFALVGVTPDDLGDPLPTWHEIDFDSEPLYATVRCPVLLIHGADEANLPVPETLEVWRQAATTSGNTQIEHALVPNAGHWPGTPDRTREGINPAYTKILQNWLGR